MGRNLSAELDEMKGKMGEMSATQTRIEETLLTLKEAISLLGALRVTQSTSSTSIPHTTPLATPVGDGYQPINVGIHGYEGERIETMMKAGKLPLSGTEGASKKGFPPKKKEPEVSYLQSQPFSQSRYPTPAPVSQIPTNSVRPTFNHYYQQPRQNENRIPNLLPFPRVLPLEPPFPAWYNPNLTCQYHMNVPGHSIEDCEAFKRAVRRLIAAGKLDIQEEATPNIVSNPIPNHEGGGRVNALEKEGLGIKRVSEIRTPMAEVFEGLKRVGYGMTVPTSLIRKKERCYKESVCAYHSGGVGHDIECCWDFKARVQGLLNRGVIQARRKIATREEVNVVEPFILRVSSLNQLPAPEKGGLTRSGRYYGPDEVEKMRKEKEDVEDKGEDGTEEEFLRIMKRSEFDVVEQLRKTPARISLLTLILSSEQHRKALQKVLEEAYVKPNVTPENIVNMVDPLKHVNPITFSYEEVITMPEKSPRALHITLKCVNQVVARIMVKNGYQRGKGLGRHLQGKRAPISLSEKQDKFGLGYKTSFEGDMQSLSFGERYPKPIPHLRETFPAPAEVMQPEGREGASTSYSNQHLGRRP
ncbi:G-patch domain [Sesbania bispinosa]|nr:G-patch domain [Sesbania bispinosa]